MADTPEELDKEGRELAEEVERRRKQGRPSLDEEIVRRYDPGRLANLVVKGAGRGERLELGTRSDMERMLPGHDFGNVRVFRGPLAEEVTRRHKADAVTIANTGMILVRESPRSAPGTASGRALIAHELTHVAQAQRGMVFAKEGGGEGEHEEEAEAVEHEALGSHFAAEGATDASSMARQEARRRMVFNKVMELLQEDLRLAAERNGR